MTNLLVSYINVYKSGLLSALLNKLEFLNMSTNKKEKTCLKPILKLSNYKYTI
jgi:hypothetical protein